MERERIFFLIDRDGKEKERDGGMMPIFQAERDESPRRGKEDAATW